jgi:ABC-2 type transport system ATP-binding protein
MLRVEKLTKVFGNTVAVNDLSFHLAKGKICGFVGPNGAGKTTTMRSIATLENPTMGEIFLDGISIFENPYAIRRMVGFMPDHLGVYPMMNVRDYLEFYARAYEVEPAVRPKRIDQIMDFTGLVHIEDKFVETLSKGMRQRLNLGRALINDPKVMVMDEPAAGLDPRARIELRFLIKNLAELGKTIFISSHILSELSEFCDHLLVIDKGRKITYGSFEEIQRGLQPTLQIHVRLLGSDRTEGVERFLMERPGVTEVSIEENGTLTFEYSEDRATLPALIRDLMNEGFPVIEFRPRTMSMEDVFIQITEGSF